MNHVDLVITIIFKNPKKIMKSPSIIFLILEKNRKNNFKILKHGHFYKTNKSYGFTHTNYL